jgi:aerobic C4-dicarboxylate transport protein
VSGVGLIVGIDRFMSEARALTNFAGNAVATVLVGGWTGELDRSKMSRVLAGADPFDEVTMQDESGDARAAAPATAVRPVAAPVG